MANILTPCESSCRGSDSVIWLRNSILQEDIPASFDEFICFNSNSPSAVRCIASCTPVLYDEQKSWRASKDKCEEAKPKATNSENKGKNPLTFSRSNTAIVVRILGNRKVTM